MRIIFARYCAACFPIRGDWCVFVGFFFFFGPHTCRSTEGLSLQTGLLRNDKVYYLQKKKKVICSVFFFSFFFFVCFFFVCFTVELRRCICPHVSSCTHTQDHLFLTRVVPWRFQNSDHRLAIKGERGLLFGVDGFASSSLSFSFLFFFSPWGLPLVFGKKKKAVFRLQGAERSASACLACVTEFTVMIEITPPSPLLQKKKRKRWRGLLSPIGVCVCLL